MNKRQQTIKEHNLSKTGLKLKKKKKKQTIKQVNSKKLLPMFFLTVFFTSFLLRKQHATVLII